MKKIIATFCATRFGAADRPSSKPGECYAVSYTNVVSLRAADATTAGEAKNSGKSVIEVSCMSRYALSYWRGKPGCRGAFITQKKLLNLGLTKFAWVADTRIICSVDLRKKQVSQVFPLDFLVDLDPIHAPDVFKNVEGALTFLRGFSLINSQGHMAPRLLGFFTANVHENYPRQIPNFDEVATNYFSDMSRKLFDYCFMPLLGNGERFDLGVQMSYFDRSKNNTFEAKQRRKRPHWSPIFTGRMFQDNDFNRLTKFLVLFFCDYEARVLVGSKPVARI